MSNLYKQLDVLFVHPNASEKIYQDLSKRYAAIEPPVWALLLAQACRAKGYGVGILDCDAEGLTDEEVAECVKEINPGLVCWTVYGQNPNSGTTSMTGAVSAAQLLKETYPQYKICFVGSHTSALPREVLSYSFIDFVLLNEGVYGLLNLLESPMTKWHLYGMPGVGFKDNGEIVINRFAPVVPQDKMDMDLPGYAWDLLPYKEKPLDLYRAHFWHADFNHDYRTPFAALYTSLGCRFKCDFCMINILNRTTGTHAADSNIMRFWSPEFIVKEFEKLVDMGVETVRISDEMFFLDKRYFEPLLNSIVEKGLGEHLRMWTYSRIDTVRDKYLDLFKRAGINWLALGIEAGNQNVRQEVTKGKFQEMNIRAVVDKIRDHDISVIANYMFGLPEDNMETMQETLDLSIELNTEMWNAYTSMALPGSPLYYKALENNWKLPSTYEGYGFLSYDCEPLDTKHITGEQALKFRDEAFNKYFSRPEYLSMIEKKFGPEQRNNITEMCKVKLRRRALERTHTVS